MNDLSSRQWRLDTPTPYGTPQAVLWPGNVYIKQAIFTGYTSQGQTLILKDKNGRIVWESNGKSDLSDDGIRDVGWVEGIVLDTLAAGLCIVHIK